MSAQQHLGEILIDVIASLSFEIGRRASEEIRERGMRFPVPEEIERIARAKAHGVLVDYFLGQFKPASYVIADDGKSITCVRCGSTSYNLNDVKERYCGHCKRFHVEGP